MPKLKDIEGLTRKEREQAKEAKRKYFHEYYSKNKQRILEKAKENYKKTKKKIARCKECGKEIPGAHGMTRYCKKCLYGPGHGESAHLKAAARWFRKNYLTKKHDKDTIKLYVVDFSKKENSYEKTGSKRNRS